MRSLPRGSAGLRRFHRFAAALVATALVTLATSGATWATTRVTLIVDGTSSAVQTRCETVGLLLEQVGVGVAHGDIVNPSPSTQVAAGTTIIVRHAVPVVIDAAGNRLALDVVGTSVADALVAAGFDPAVGTGVTPSLDTKLQPGMVISVADVFMRLVQVEEPIPFKTKIHLDASKPIGARTIECTGTPGTRLRVYTTLVRAGKEGVRRLAVERTVSTAVDEVVAIGTKRTASVGVERVFRSIGSGSLSGHLMRVEATGYTAGHGCDFRTATGTLARYGTVAVDPRVIPLGSRLWIEGYGYAIAADTGGAIDGKRIDLCFDTLQEAVSWGRRSVNIIVLP